MMTERVDDFRLRFSFPLTIIRVIVASRAIVATIIGDRLVPDTFDTALRQVNELMRIDFHPVFKHIVSLRMFFG